MTLNDSQKAKVADWVKAGDSLGDIQNKILSEFGVSMTFMDVRFLVDDLDVTLVDKVVVKPEIKSSSPESNLSAAKNVPEQSAETSVPQHEMPLSSDVAAENNVQVSIDKLPHPNYAMSGTVVFPDGEKAIWVIDAEGRFGMQTDTPGYKPSAEYVRAFQMELEEEFKKNGM